MEQVQRQRLTCCTCHGARTRCGDGGEITWVGGQPLTASGLETAAYLSLFGGNQEDSGLADGEAKQWWANFEEPVAERRQRSQTQALLAGLPATPFNLRRVEKRRHVDRGLEMLLPSFAGHLSGYRG